MERGPTVRRRRVRRAPSREPFTVYTFSLYPPSTACKKWYCSARVRRASSHEPRQACCQANTCTSPPAGIGSLSPGRTRYRTCSGFGCLPPINTRARTAQPVHRPLRFASGRGGRGAPVPGLSRCQGLASLAPPTRTAPPSPGAGVPLQLPGAMRRGRHQVSPAHTPPVSPAGRPMARPGSRSRRGPCGSDRFTDRFTDLLICKSFHRPPEAGASAALCRLAPPAVRPLPRRRRRALSAAADALACILHYLASGAGSDGLHHDL